MIGTELLQLLQGDPLAQMRMGPQPAPNPNPHGAPPPQQRRMPPVNQPTMSATSRPLPAGIGGPPGHFETLPDQLSQSPHWVPGPAPRGPITRGPAGP